MFRKILLICLICLSAESANYLEIVKKHCYECHGKTDPDAALDLSIFESQKSFYVHFDTLTEFYDAVKSGDMPPEDELQPSKEEKAKACGYYAITKNGLERVNMMKFLNALIDAEGIDLDGKSGNFDFLSPVRKPSFVPISNVLNSYLFIVGISL